MLKIWGRLNSVNVQKVMLAVYELHLPHLHTNAGGQYGVNDTPAYLKMNPTGLVPTIDDDGFVLWESNAIVRYLLAKHDAGTLWPADPQARAGADRWMDWSSLALMSPMTPAFVQLVRTPAARRDPQVVAQSVAATEKHLAVLEQELAKRWYLCGHAPTAADIAVAPLVHRWFALDVARQARPAVAAWYQRLMQRPAFSRFLTLPLT
jgi:glutathione S-transferase